MPDEAAPDRPKIRDIVTAAELEGMATDSGMSEAEMGKLLAPFLGLSAGGAQMAAAAGEALADRFGLKHETAARTTLACSYPAAVKALVFALASRRYGITTAFDTPKGAYFEAALPKDLWSMGGTLTFDLAEESPGTAMLSGASEVGQAWDWGKGKRALGAVMEKAEDFARRLGG
jgi:hypothetical protein